MAATTRPAPRTSGSPSKQRADGGWHAYYLGDDVEDPTLDTNVTCYVATGAWHHHLVTGDTAYLREQWPTVEAAIDFALDFQRETGEIAWRGDDPDDGALLTGSSSIHHSLKCAIAIAERLGHERPDWELSLGALAIAIAHRPDLFLDKDRWAMDWYYPILGGVLRGYPPTRASRRGGRRSSCAGRGIRCVSDRPWVTAAETCELVMALDAIGSHEHARELFASVQFLRAEGGGYWTGANFDDEAFHLDGELYPVEQPTWNSAAVVLAANALRRHRADRRAVPRRAAPRGPQRRRAARRRRRDRTGTLPPFLSRHSRRSAVNVCAS